MESAIADTLQALDEAIGRLAIGRRYSVRLEVEHGRRGTAQKFSARVETIGWTSTHTTAQAVADEVATAVGVEVGS